jgi:hypothetical protein
MFAPFGKLGLEIANAMVPPSASTVARAFTFREVAKVAATKKPKATTASRNNGKSFRFIAGINCHG